VIVIPAIDLLGGKAVRLREGCRDAATVYHERPWELAAEFAADGARTIHVVDLDAAFGEARQIDLLRGVIDAARVPAPQGVLAELRVPVQLGGGLRDRAAIEAALASGAAFAVLGTAAVRDPALVEAVCRSYPDRIIVAVDARDGRVAVAGWAETSDVTAIDLARRAADWGAAKILYTDVARDGLRTGPAVDATFRLQAAVSCPVIASGGVSSLADLRALSAAGVRECIVGRALYDRVFTLAEALAEVSAC
jgi:phosphoribosylformimino-5-aminoimidazole carboxamide ribotide isomerase